jgi:hypothetical protein
MIVIKAESPPKRCSVVLQSSLKAFKNIGVTIIIVPTTEERMPAVTPFTANISRGGNHCCIRRTLVGSLAAIVKPKAKRDTRKMANVVADAWRKMNRAPRPRVTVVSMVRWHRASQTLIGKIATT